MQFVKILLSFSEEIRFFFKKKTGDKGIHSRFAPFCFNPVSVF